ERAIRADRHAAEPDITRTYASPRFLTRCRFFFALQGKKEPTKEVKYHAAAGYNRFCISPNNMKRARLTYLAQTQPGFEAIAADEIAQSLDGAIVQGTRSVADKNGMLLFDYNGDAADLMAPR